MIDERQVANAEFTGRTNKATTTGDVLHETPPHQPCGFEVTPTWRARLASSKHSHQLNTASAFPCNDLVIWPCAQDSYAAQSGRASERLCAALCSGCRPTLSNLAGGLPAQCRQTVTPPRPQPVKRLSPSGWLAHAFGAIRAGGVNRLAPALSRPRPVWSGAMGLTTTRSDPGTAGFTP
jgi:hypothetical protein